MLPCSLLDSLAGFSVPLSFKGQIGLNYSRHAIQEKRDLALPISKYKCRGENLSLPLVSPFRFRPFRFSSLSPHPSLAFIRETAVLLHAFIGQPTSTSRTAIRSNTKSARENASDLDG